MSKKDFCCVDNFSVIIPYRDLERMLESANKIAHIESIAKRMEERGISYATSVLGNA